MPSKKTSESSGSLGRSYSSQVLVLVLVGILAISVIAALVIWNHPSSGTQVVVTIDGKLYGTYDLHKTQTVVISGPGGEWHNTLTIQGGKAAITESDCDNQICVHTPALTQEYFGIIVCLPHGLVVELQEP